MPSALAHRTRTGSWLRLLQIAATISLLFSGSAWAQTANGGGVQSAKVQAAHADWRRLSQTEVNCVDQSLRSQRTSLWSLIQRGVDPSDPTVAKLRTACRAQARAPNTSVAAHSGSQAQAAAVESALDSAVAGKAAADKAAADKAAADKFIDQYSTWDEKLHGVVAANIRAQQRYRFRLFKFATLGE